MKKFFLILVSCASLMQPAFSQIVIKSDNASLIEGCLEKAVYLFRQEYQIEDTLTHKRFALDGRSDFGSMISFAVRTHDGYVTMEDVVSHGNRMSITPRIKTRSIFPVYQRH